MSKQERVTAIIDTNVFLSTGDEVFHKFTNTDIVIPLLVYRDLDKYCSDQGGRGVSARVVISRIEQIQDSNAGVNMSKEGVRIPNTSNTLRIESNHTSPSRLVHDLRKPPSHDVTMMAVTTNLDEDARRSNGQHVQLVTNSSSLRFLSRVIQKIDARPYGETSNRKFTGRIDAEFGDDKGQLADSDYDKLVYSAEFDRIPSHAILHVSEGNVEDWILKENDSYCQLNSRQWQSVGPIYPKNPEQAVATRWLNDDSIQMLSLGGVAGAGKSLLSIAYGLDSVDKGRFSRVTVFRSMYAVGQQEQGFLKGDADDKIRPWAQAVWDDVRKYDACLKYRKNSKSGTARKKGMLKAVNSQETRNSADGKRVPAIEVKYGDMISVEPLTYIRGRTFENQLIIVDDAQSLDRSVLLDVVSRLGEDSKIIFTFDMNQQDNPHLSAGTSIESLNGRLASERSFAHIDFTHSERSRLAQLASRLLSEM